MEYDRQAGLTTIVDVTLKLCFKELYIGTIVGNDSQLPPHSSSWAVTQSRV